MDTAQDSQAMFFIALHFKTNSSQTIARVKTDTGAHTCPMPLSHFKKMLPHKINTTATSKMHYFPQKRHGQLMMNIYRIFWDK